MPLLNRIAEALERLAPQAPPANDLDAADAFIWHAEGDWLEPVREVNRVARPVARHRPSARHPGREHRAVRRRAAGQQRAAMGRARHGQKLAGQGRACRGQRRARHSALALVEIHREDIPSLPACCASARAARGAFCFFATICPSTRNDTSYKSLKAALEGGIEGRPANVLLYATSNRRHLMPRDMMENERSTAINPSEAVEEKVSLSDRFGLWLGFHNFDQETISRWCAAMPRISAWNAADQLGRGRLGARAAPARAASPGNSSRISPAGSASRCPDRSGTRRHQQGGLGSVSMSSSFAWIA